MTEPILSILICTLPERREMLDSLLNSLFTQIEDQSKVEILTDDSVKFSTGRKRDWLLNKAKGKYIVYIDDDDSVPDYYVEEILKGAEADCDCMGTLGYMTTDGGNRIEWELSKDLPNDTIIRNGKNFYLRKTNHISPVKRELALLVGFDNISNGEDKNYSDKLNKHLKTEYKIPRIMYHYDYRTGSKAYLK